MSKLSTLILAGAFSMVAFMVPASPYVIPTTMIDVIKHLGYQTNLQFVVDAGDAASYAGSGDTVSDVSGSAFHWQVGSAAGADANDPTYVGVAGRQSSGEYFRSVSFDDELYAAARSTFTDSLHQNNAVFTYVAWVRMAQHDAVNGASFFRTGAAAATRGVLLGDGIVGNDLALGVYTSAAAVVADIQTGLTLPTTSWMFVALALDEAAGTWRARVNGNVASGAVTYSSPEAGASGIVPRIGSTNDQAGGYSGDNNSVAMWSRMLSAAELTALYTATKTKFGL
jgi:hypothetical protein